MLANTKFIKSIKNKSLIISFHQKTLWGFFLLDFALHAQLLPDVSQESLKTSPAIGRRCGSTFRTFSFTFDVLM